MAQALDVRWSPRARLEASSDAADRAGAWLIARPAWLWFALVVVAGLLLRAIPYAVPYPLHRDEALYGTWARMIADGSDPVLLAAWVDKPPLVLYLLAASIRLLGATDTALRLPGMLAGMLILPATYFLARRAGSGQRAALLAMAFVAASPYTILFSPTAFTDTWLVLWLTLAAWAALAGRPFIAGVSLGFAVASKQTGLLGVPLVVMLLLAADSSSSRALFTFLASRFTFLRSTPLGHVLRFTFCVSALLGFASIFGVVYWWDSLRWAKRPSFWGRSLETYGGLYLADPATWPERGRHWAEQARYLFGDPMLTAAVLALVVLGIYAAWRRRRTIEVVFAAFIGLYLVVHVFVTFQPWDRYLLPLVPLLAVMACRGFAVAWQVLPRVGSGALPRMLALAGLVLTLALSAWAGSAARVPVGSDHSAYAGQDQAVATLRTLAPRSKVYHHSLGWQLDWYLYGAAQRPVWWSDAAILAQDAAYTAAGDVDRPQWLVIAWATDAPVAQEALAAIQARGLTLDERQRVYRPDGTLSFTLYEILPPRETS